MESLGNNPLDCFSKLKHLTKNSRRRKLGNNTYIVEGDDWIGVRFHNTVIAKFYCHYAEYTSNGYHTVTTKERLSNCGLEIFAQNGEWYIRFYTPQHFHCDYKFEDGVTIHYDDHATNAVKVDIYEEARAYQKRMRDRNRELFGIKRNIFRTLNFDDWDMHFIRAESGSSKIKTIHFVHKCAGNRLKYAARTLKNIKYCPQCQTKVPESLVMHAQLRKISK